MGSSSKLSSCVFSPIRCGSPVRGDVRGVIVVMQIFATNTEVEVGHPVSTLASRIPAWAAEVVRGTSSTPRFCAHCLHVYASDRPAQPAAGNFPQIAPQTHDHSITRLQPLACSTNTSPRNCYVAALFNNSYVCRISFTCAAILFARSLRAKRQGWGIDGEHSSAGRTYFP